MMTTPSVIRPHHNPKYGNIPYGLGLQIYKNDKLLEFSHSGSLNGYSSTLLYYPAQKISLVVLENVSRNPMNVERQIKVHDDARDVIQKHIA